MRPTDELYVTSRAEWRVWLQKNHAARKQVWLIYYKKHTGCPSIPYDDSVEEAICFGWIDSLVKRIDDEKYARKFTPRKLKSNWSGANKRRAQKMIKNGKMTEAGLLRIEEAKKSGEWFKNAPPKKALVIPPYIEKALIKSKRALNNFNNLAKSYRRQYIGWISSAKRKETREKRLVEAIALLEKNEKLGMK